MKLVLVTSLAVLLGLGVSGSALAHGNGAVVGGSVYWANDGYAIGLNYGGPYVAPYYAPPRYVYAPRAYRGAYRYGAHYDHGRGYRRGYGKRYSRGYRKGHRDGHGHGREYRRYDDHWARKGR